MIGPSGLSVARVALMQERLDWDFYLKVMIDLEQIEAFRVALLLAGRDTRSARLAIRLRLEELQKPKVIAPRPRKKRKPKNRLHFGPWLPAGHPILIERECEAWARFRQNAVDMMKAPNLILEHLRKAGRVK